MAVDRIVDLTREADRIRLSFHYDPRIIAEVKKLPYAVFDPQTKTWTAALCSQTVDILRVWYKHGRTTPSIDDLLDPAEIIEPAIPATLRSGTDARPYKVFIGIRDDRTFQRLRAVLGAAWDKKTATLSYPPSAAAPLAALVEAGLIDDPEHLLAAHAATVVFDSATGTFSVRGPNGAAAAFAKHFPATDVVKSWKDKGLDAGFMDSFSEQMYYGELARVNPQDLSGVNVELFEYQKSNVAISLVREGHCVFDEPGLGKTVTGIAVGSTLLNAGKISRVIVVVPAAVRSQWASEIYRISGDDSIVVVTGSKKQRQQAYDTAADSRWLIIHYDVLARDKPLLRDLFDSALVIADEAHRVKSSSAARTKALKDLCKLSARRLALTGTPIETSPHEWYEIISGFALPGVLGSSFEFNERYRWRNQWGGFEGARNVPELKARSKFFYSRHTKAQVATHLPPLRVQNLILDPDDAYAAALRKAHILARDELRAAAATGQSSQTLFSDPDAATAATDAADMTATGLLRLLCSSPRCVSESDSGSAKVMLEAGLIPDDDGPKIAHLRATAAALHAAYLNRTSASQPGHIPTPEEVNGERMVVFTFSRRFADLLSMRLAEDGIGHVLYTGSTSHADRDAAVAAFTDPASDVQVFIATDAAAEGLNLGKCCSLLINADLAWTASRMAQRAQRIHRIDGTAPRYLVINLMLSNTIEAGIFKLLSSRAALTDALFGEQNAEALTSGTKSRSKVLTKLATSDILQSFSDLDL